MMSLPHPLPPLSLSLSTPQVLLFSPFPSAFSPLPLSLLYSLSPSEYGLERGVESASTALSISFRWIIE